MLLSKGNKELVCCLLENIKGLYELVDVVVVVGSRVVRSLNDRGCGYNESLNKLSMVVVVVVELRGGMGWGGGDSFCGGGGNGMAWGGGDSFCGGGGNGVAWGGGDSFCGGGGNGMGWGVGL